MAGKEIDHVHTDEIVCPYCGEEQGDSWEWGTGREEDSESECGYCDKTFRWSRNIEVTYTTRKMEEKPDV